MTLPASQTGSLGTTMMLEAKDTLAGSRPKLGGIVLPPSASSLCLLTCSPHAGNSRVTLRWHGWGVCLAPLLSEVCVK